ncbi:hypothetical protein MLD38_010923 [Melastoma candidum]|uniref:Uncharacterized protein n=1 Tax=Melastoma candidum TaxID=119954 RepID=A0ACB9R4W4_9MYRT|nr:hypothetical protein MLD38_010923 [Melastoma candidum]
MAMMLGILFLVVVAVLSLCAFLKPLSRDAKSPSLPPGPRGLPVLGYLPFLGDNLQSKFSELADVYGPIYKLKLGRKVYVVVNSPVIAKEIVREQDSNFSHRRPNIASFILSYRGRDIAFSNYGPYWRMMRKLFVKEIMSGQSLNACYDLRRSAVRKSVAEVWEMAGLSVDVGKLALQVMINAMISMLWGNSNGEDSGANVDSEFKLVMKKLMELLAKPNVSDFFPVLSWFDLQGVQKQAREVNSWFDRFHDSLIRAATDEGKRRSSDKGKDLLQVMLQLDFKSEEDLTRTPGNNNQEIKGMLQDIVVGGTDTTATTIEWVMAELLQHQYVMQSVREELTEVIGIDSMVEEYHLPKLKYLKAVVKETMRLHPPLPLLVPRTPDCSCVVGGYTIPKGSMVFLNMAYIHTDPKLWTNPKDFMPERFLKEPDKFEFSGNNSVYLPFGSGRRICAGLPLAEKMLMFVLANFLHSFDWELPEGTTLEFSADLGIVSRKRTPLEAIPRPRLVNQEFYSARVAAK